MGVLDLFVFVVTRAVAVAVAFAAAIAVVIVVTVVVVTAAIAVVVNAGDAIIFEDNVAAALIALQLLTLLLPQLLLYSLAFPFPL